MPVIPKCRSGGRKPRESGTGCTRFTWKSAVGVELVTSVATVTGLPGETIPRRQQWDSVSADGSTPPTALIGKRKGKEEYLYSAFLHQGTLKALRHGSHSFTCEKHHACLSFVAFTRCRHHSNCGSRHPIAAHYSFIDPERMKG